MPSTYYTQTGLESNPVLIRRSNCINTASGTALPVSDRPVGRLHTGRSLTGSAVPDAVINIIRPPDDEHMLPETCRGL